MQAAATILDATLLLIGVAGVLLLPPMVAVAGFGNGVGRKADGADGSGTHSAAVPLTETTLTSPPPRPRAKVHLGDDRLADSLPTRAPPTPTPQHRLSLRPRPNPRAGNRPGEPGPRARVRPRTVCLPRAVVT